jgi:hypothetical protein
LTTPNKNPRLICPKPLGFAGSPRPHHQALALLVIQIELRDRRGLGRLLVGCLDVADVLERLRRISEDFDAPRS